MLIMKMELGCPVIVLCHMLCYILMKSHCHDDIVVGPANYTLTSFEDSEIEKTLKLLNKPAVKIIKSIYGERYGCMDFYTQPGLDHPSMKNHTFQYKMRLTSYPEGSKMQRETRSNKTFGHLWENGVGCPIGTVPIRRVTKDDLLRLKSFGGDNSYPWSSWNNTYKPTSTAFVGGMVAVMRTTKKKPRSYYGASMNVGINTPSVQPLQASSARMQFQIRNEYIQVGWTVNPQLYRDFRTRLFIFTNAGGHSCYNQLCPDKLRMVQVRSDIPIDLPFDSQKDFDMAILKDKANGNWWLLLDTAQVEIGFWPASTFREGSGTGVDWGGEVYSSLLSSPPMGNGRFPVGNPAYDSYIRFITIVDEKYKTDKTVGNTESHTDNKGCYKASDLTESFWPFGHILFYGGPGCKNGLS